MTAAEFLPTRRSIASLRRAAQDCRGCDLYRDANRVKEVMQSFEDAKARLQQLYEHWEEAVELN